MGGIQPIGPQMPAMPVQPAQEALAAHGVQPATAPAVQDVLALSDISAPLTAVGVTGSAEIAAVNPSIRVDRVLALREAIAAGTYETETVINGTVEALWSTLKL